MFKIISFVFVFSLHTGLYAQSSKASYVIIAGEISNATTPVKTINLIKSTTQIFESIIIPIAIPVREGKFYIKIPLDSLMSFHFKVDDREYHGRFMHESYLYLEPGDSIYISINDPDAKDLQQIQFTGRGAVKMMLFREIGNMYAQYNRLIPREDFEAYFKQFVEMKTKMVDIIKSYHGKLSEVAYERILLNRLATVSTTLPFYFFDTPYASDSTKRRVYLAIREHFRINELMGSNGLRPEHARDIEDLAILEYVVKNGLPFTRKGFKDPVIKYKVLNETIDNPAVKNIVLGRIVYFWAKYKGWTATVDTLAAMYYKGFNKDDAYYREIVRLEKEIKTILQGNAQAYQFKLKDTLGRWHHMSDFIGKVVLIDFMFNGCIGCYGLTKKMPDIEKVFHGRDVEFISISIDPNLAKFKKGIGKFCSAGSLALYTNGMGSTHPIIRHYNIVAYPTLILIDKRGRVISGRAPDPRLPEGEAELIAMIEKGLKEN